MFQSIRINSPIYILHRDKLMLEIGYVTNVIGPKPKYSTPIGVNNSSYVIDLTININGSIVNYNGIPANLDIADFNNGEQIIIADNKEAMNSEILNLKQKSIDIINSVEEHKNRLLSYDDMLNKLNPEYAENQKQKEEIKELKEQLRKLTELITNNKENKL